MPLLGDASMVLSKLAEGLEGNGRHRSGWLEEINKVRKEYVGETFTEKGLNPAEIIRQLRSRVRAEDILTTEVGQHQMWAALYWKALKPRTFITSGGLGTMGYGLPAAIGAAFARPGRPVTCLSGDGSFFMNVQELETCVRYRLPVRLVLLNNRSLGMVRQWQELFWGKRYIQTCEEPSCSLAEVARAFGFAAWVVDDRSRLEETLDAAFSAEGPSFVECPIATEELVYPMVPAGGRIDGFLHPTKSNGSSAST
jgi:acetolactate synthase-1/2/3 large subunit